MNESVATPIRRLAGLKAPQAPMPAAALAARWRLVDSGDGPRLVCGWQALRPPAAAGATQYRLAA